MSEQPETLFPSFEEAMEMLTAAGLYYQVADAAGDELVIKIPISDKKRLTDATDDCII
jgi:hypothetical protein